MLKQIRMEFLDNWILVISFQGSRTPGGSSKPEGQLPPTLAHISSDKLSLFQSGGLGWLCSLHPWIFRSSYGPGCNNQARRVPQCHMHPKRPHECESNLPLQQYNQLQAAKWNVGVRSLFILSSHRSIHRLYGSPLLHSELVCILKWSASVHGAGTLEEKNIGSTMTKVSLTKTIDGDKYIVWNHNPMVLYHKSFFFIFFIIDKQNILQYKTIRLWFYTMYSWLYI